MGRGYRPDMGRSAVKAALVLTGVAGISGIVVGLGLLLWPTSEPRLRVSDLAVEALPLPPATQFVLPAGAALEGFPTGPHGPGCSAEDLAWLRGTGRERIPGFPVSVRNAGTADGVLSVTEVWAEGERSLVSEPVVVFDCPGAGLAAGTRLEVDTDSATPAQRADDGAAAGQFSVGLVPGESRDLQVVLTGRQDFRGTFELRVSDGGRAGVVRLPVAGTQEVERPGIGAPGPLTVRTEEGAQGDVRFRCSDGATEEACSAAGARARAARLWDLPALAASAVQAGLDAAGCGDAGRQSVALDQVWRGFYGKNPTRGDRAYDEVVARPVRGLSTSCGRDHALAVLDGTAMAAAGHADDLRATLTVEPAAEPQGTPAPAALPSCAEESLRGGLDDGGAQPLGERTDAGAWVYDGFRAHACAVPYALVEASTPGAGYAQYWLLEAVDERWVIRDSSSVGADTPPTRALFDCSGLADDGMDIDAGRSALGPAEAGIGRPFCS